MKNLQASLIISLLFAGQFFIVESSAPQFDINLPSSKLKDDSWASIVNDACRRQVAGEIGFALGVGLSSVVGQYSSSGAVSLGLNQALGQDNTQNVINSIEALTVLPVLGSVAISSDKVLQKIGIPSSNLGKNTQAGVYALAAIAGCIGDAVLYSSLSEKNLDISEAGITCVGLTAFTICMTAWERTSN